METGATQMFQVRNNLNEVVEAGFGIEHTARIEADRRNVATGLTHKVTAEGSTLVLWSTDPKAWTAESGKRRVGGTFGS
jgi:hypothetical protein